MLVGTKLGTIRCAEESATQSKEMKMRLGEKLVSLAALSVIVGGATYAYNRERLSHTDLNPMTPRLLLNDCAEASVLQALPRGLRRFLIGVRAYLHSVKAVALRGQHKCREALLLQIVRYRERFRFLRERRHLQTVRSVGKQRR